jgi:hypothetical protein
MATAAYLATVVSYNCKWTITFATDYHIFWFSLFFSVWQTQPVLSIVKPFWVKG